MIRKNARWNRIKFNVLIFGPVFSIALLIVLLGVYQDHGHSHSEIPVGRDTAKINATEIIAQLVKNQKLDETWAAITASSVEKKEFKGYMEWEVVFVNKKVTDPTKQKIYVFLTLSGKHVAVNYSGN